MENAIGAASKAEEKKIMFTMRFSGGVLFLQIKNTFEGNIRIENGKIIGKKSAINHGIGLRSVQDLVKAQNGDMDISVENELFIVEGIIPLE